MYIYTWPHIKGPNVMFETKNNMKKLVYKQNTSNLTVVKLGFTDTKRLTVIELLSY